MGKAKAPKLVCVDRMTRLATVSIPYMQGLWGDLLDQTCKGEQMCKIHGDKIHPCEAHWQDRQRWDG
eukprot:5621794-Amphidinium_carterae.2